MMLVESFRQRSQGLNYFGCGARATYCDYSIVTAELRRHLGCNHGIGYAVAALFSQPRIGPCYVVRSAAPQNENSFAGFWQTLWLSACVCQCLCPAFWLAGDFFGSDTSEVGGSCGV
jgi:hypothetical protein